MSMADYERAKAIIVANSAKADFVGPRPRQLIRKAEAALGVRFPPTYRQFLLDFGAGNFRSAEFYGVIDESWNESSVPDGVWCTLSEREQVGLPSNLVIVGDTGMGEFYVVDADDKNGPVWIVCPGADLTAREWVASDFGEFFLQQVKQVSG